MLTYFATTAGAAERIGDALRAAEQRRLAASARSPRTGRIPASRHGRRPLFTHHRFSGRLVG